MESINKLIEKCQNRIRVLANGKGKEYIKSAKCSEIYKLIKLLEQLRLDIND